CTPGETAVRTTTRRGRGPIARHQSRLKELVGEINTCHAAADKALKAGVRAALLTGEKLNLAHRLLKRLTTKLRHAGEPRDALPTWKGWVQDNLTFSVRTSYYY